jgi:hypothetical protein
MPLREFETAQKAVEKLGLIEFINAHKTLIDEKIRACDAHVMASEATGDTFGDMTFIATCLPLAAGIVHVGSELKLFQDAQNWVREDLELPDSTSVLSALTLLYLVQKGWEENLRDPAWIRIHGRVKRFLSSEILTEPGPTA